MQANNCGAADYCDRLVMLPKIRQPLTMIFRLPHPSVGEGIIDAIHIAAATVHGLDYLLTGNCKHIANAQIQGKLAEISFDFGYELPILCTPYELLGN